LPVNIFHIGIKRAKIGIIDTLTYNMPGIDSQVRKNLKYVVLICPEKEVFIVWDFSKHRESIGSAFTMSTGPRWHDSELNRNTFIARYREIGHPGSGVLEKFYVVGSSHFQYFFENYYWLMQFNENDFPDSRQAPSAVTAQADWLTPPERKKYSCIQRSRDSHFRTEVLNAYGHKCAICRCEVEYVLQAAHERGYDVASTEYDDPKHGICLCANHHLMYDNKLIDIDLKKFTIQIQKDENKIKAMPWYQIFTSRDSGKIVKRADSV
jgi:hypothetical protein